MARTGHFGKGLSRRALDSVVNSVYTNYCKLNPRLQLACLDHCFNFEPEPRFSGGMPQFGRICAMECAINAGLRRRSSRSVNMTARRNPARAPRNPSVIERLLKVRRPWPVRRFTYLPDSNSYLCPAGQQLNYGGHNARNRTHVYIGGNWHILIIWA
jgi:hypothetical protein